MPYIAKGLSFAGGAARAVGMQGIRGGYRLGSYLWRQIAAASWMERSASAISDFYIQYNANTMRGFLNPIENLRNINYTQTGINAVIPVRMPFINSLIGSGLYWAPTTGYKGFGSSNSNDFEVMGNVILGYSGGRLGNYSQPAFQKLPKTPEFWKSFYYYSYGNINTSIYQQVWSWWLNP